MTTSKRLDDIEARLSKASPGPWKSVDNANNHWGLVEVVGPRVRIFGFTIATNVSKKEGLQTRADRDMIAHSPEDIAYLLRIAMAALVLVESAELIGTEHSGMCATVACNCTGHAKIRVDLKNAIVAYKSSVGEGE